MGLQHHPKGTILQPDTIPVTQRALRRGVHYTALDRRLQRLAAMMQTDLRLDKTCGRYRVETADGSKQISPRLSAHQMLDWVEAGIAVLENMGRGTHGKS